MSSATLSGCINHPSIEAVGRCKQCGKPFCSTCEIPGPTGKFCSDPCKQRHEVFVKRAAKLDDMRRTRSLMVCILSFSRERAGPNPIFTSLGPPDLTSRRYIKRINGP